MNKFVLTFLTMIVITSMHAQYNVLSYYAVGNSLDGQPLIEAANILRFYPIYAMRDSIDHVEVTLFKGNDREVLNAEMYDSYKYWQVALPPFQIGESIQRLEVEVHFRLPAQIVKKYKLMQKELEIYSARSTIYSNEDVVSVASELEKLRPEQLTIRSAMSGLLRLAGSNVDLDFKSELIDSHIKSDIDLRENDLSELISKNKPPLWWDQLSKDTIRVLDSLFNDPTKLIDAKPEDVRDYGKWKSAKQHLDSVLQILASVRPGSGLSHIALKYDQVNSLRLADWWAFCINQYNLNESRISVLQDKASKMKNVESTVEQHRIDSLQVLLENQLESEVESGLSDTNYTGPSIRKSDIAIDPGFLGARIMYRNYKDNLRRLTALDAGERVSIFRIRYVPFAYTGLGTGAPGIVKFAGENNQTIFEVTLGFGDYFVPGDDFVKPSLDIGRLSVGFAITDKLFNDDAQILAMLLSYDFNSFGSVSYGINFAQHGTNVYAGMGIDKKAFELLAKALVGIFR